MKPPAEISESGWARLVLDIFGGDFRADPEKIKDVLPVLNLILESLDEREALALRGRYEDGLTFRRIGALIGYADWCGIPQSGACSHGRASQIVHNALRKMRHPSRSDKIRILVELRDFIYCIEMLQDHAAELEAHEMQFSPEKLLERAAQHESRAAQIEACVAQVRAAQAELHAAQALCAEAEAHYAKVEARYAEVEARARRMLRGGS